MNTKKLEGNLPLETDNSNQTNDVESNISFEEVKINGDIPYIIAKVQRGGVVHQINIVSISENEVEDLLFD